MSYITDAGPLVFLVLILGLVALLAAVRYLTTASRNQMHLAIGGAAATVIASLLAFVTGFQKSAGPLRQLAPDDRWILFAGLNESANNLVVALVVAMLVCLIVTAGAYRTAGR